MSDNEENYTNPIVKSIIDDITNDVVGVAFLNNIPDKDVIPYNERKMKIKIAESIIDWVVNEATENVSRSTSFRRESINDCVFNETTGKVSTSTTFIEDQKCYGYNQIDFEIIESFENENEEYYKVPMKNQNLLFTEKFKDWSKDSERPTKMNDQDLADFNVFKLKTLGALYDDRAKVNDYSEETYEAEVFPYLEHIQRQNTFSEKNRSASDPLYNINFKQDDLLNIDYSKSLSVEASKQLGSALDVPNRNTSAYCYFECSNIKKHGDGDNTPVESLPTVLIEGTMNLPLDILPPISNNDDCQQDHNKLINKQSQPRVHKDHANIDHPFFSKIDRITLDNVQSCSNQKERNDSIEDNCISTVQRTDDHHSLNLLKVASPLHYEKDKSSEWINKESDNLFKESSTISEQNAEKSFSSFYNMSPSPRFINYLYMSNKTHTDNENVHIEENKIVQSHLDRNDQANDNKSHLENCNTSGEIYSFEEDKTKMNSVSLEETNPFLIENDDNVIHLNTAEYDESTHTFKRYYEMYTENNKDINSPTKSSLLEMGKLGYKFGSNEKSLEQPDQCSISPNTLENWEEGHEVEVNIIEPVSPEDTGGASRKMLKRPRPISSDSPQTHRKKVWSSVGLVEKPRKNNTLFNGSKDEFETEDSASIPSQKNNLNFDTPLAEAKSSPCWKSSSEFDTNNLNQKDPEIQENISENNSFQTIETNIKCTEYSPCVSKSDIHHCFSRSTILCEHNFEGTPDGKKVKNNDTNTTESSFIHDTTTESKQLLDSKSNTLIKSPSRKGFLAWVISFFRRNNTKTEEEDDTKVEAKKKRNSLESNKKRSSLEVKKKRNSLEMGKRE